MFRRRNLLCLFFAAALSACVSYAPYPSETQPPCCVVKTIDATLLDVADIVELRMNVRNPNPFPLKIERFELFLTARDSKEEGVRLTFAKKLELEEYAAQEFSFVLAGAEWRPLAKHLERKRLPYHLTGEASIKTREGVRMFYIDCFGKARVTLPETPPAAQKASGPTPLHRADEGPKEKATP